MSTKFKKAYVGYNSDSRGYVPYFGNLTKQKEFLIRELLILNGFNPGWKTKNVNISEVDKHGFSSYQEDGASGYNQIKIFKLN